MSLCCFVFYFIVLYCIVLYFTVLYFVVLYFIVLYCIILYCNLIQMCTSQYDAVAMMNKALEFWMSTQF